MKSGKYKSKTHGAGTVRVIAPKLSPLPPGIEYRRRELPPMIVLAIYSFFLLHYAPTRYFDQLRFVLV